MEHDDFRTLFEAAPSSNLVLLPNLVIYAASDAYLRAVMRQREELIGRAVFEAFPDDPEEVGAHGEALMRAVFQRVLDTKQPQHLPVQRYPIPRPASQGGGYEERFWRVTNSPALDANGQVAFIIQHAEDVTDMVKLEQDGVLRSRDLVEMSARTERFAQLLDTAPDAMVIVSEVGLIQLVNVQAERLFGYTRQELIGQDLQILVPMRSRGEHGTHLRSFFANPAARSMGSDLELFGRHKDGREIPIEVSLSPRLSEGRVTVSAAIRDISERKRLERAANLLSGRLSSAVESIQDALALFDSEDKLILCNSVYRRLLQDNLQGSLVGRPFEELLDALIIEMEFPDEQARVRFREERLKRRRDPTTSFDIRLRDGRRMRVIDRMTAEGGMVKTIWDLTDEERAAEQLREARAAAEAANAAKTEFLASMSHELRTPLNAILGFAQLMQLDKRDPLSERNMERAGYVLSGGQHLLRLIDDVLDLVRIEAGRVSVSIEPVNVLEVLNEVMTTLEPIAARSGVAISLTRSAGPLPCVLADRTRFTQILMNLGSNSIKYNRRGGKVKFAFSMVAGRSYVRVTVADTGLGIPRDKQSMLFQPFQRAGQETGAIEGTGIGLVITRQLAVLMGGAVDFRSTPGEGSDFWVDLPAVNAAAAPEQATPSQPAPAGAGTSSQRGIVLYVEDNPANVSFMRDLVSAFDEVELLTAATAELGVEIACARRPQVILMDINLPGMSGLDALHELRRHPETLNIPVIALTAAASERDKHAGVQAGFYRYLTKPVKVAELLTAMEQVLAMNRR